MSVNLPSPAITNDSLISATSALTCSELTEVSLRAARTSRASSSRPFLSSHRGDSGRCGVVERTRIDQKLDKARGKRQDTVPVAWDMPKLIHAAMARPQLIKRPSRRTAEPRWEALEHSDCQFGAVAVRAPNPRPDTSRPTMSCPSDEDVDWRIEPMMLMNAPSIMVRFRPSRSPISMQLNAPNKQPSVYRATTVPWGRQHFFLFYSSQLRLIQELPIPGPWHSHFSPRQLWSAC